MVLDSSTTMIEKARQNSDAIDWRIGDIQTWYEANRFDLIFANASLHWIDDHASLTKRLLEAVKPSGIFAFQMPALYNQPVAQAIHDVSESPAWKSHRLSDRYTLLTHTPGEYYDWLAPLPKAWRANLLRKRYGLDLPPTILMPLAQAGVQLEKLVTIRLRLLDREIKVLFHIQVSREAFGTHSSGKEKL
jgi:trans-aconitate 2-methyltransferase